MIQRDECQKTVNPSPNALARHLNNPNTIPPCKSHHLRRAICSSRHFKTKGLITHDTVSHDQGAGDCQRRQMLALTAAALETLQRKHLPALAGSSGSGLADHKVLAERRGRTVGESARVSDLGGGAPHGSIGAAGDTRVGCHVAQGAVGGKVDWLEAVFGCLEDTSAAVDGRGGEKEQKIGEHRICKMIEVSCKSARGRRELEVDKGIYQGTCCLRAGGFAASNDNGCVAINAANVELAIAGGDDIVGEIYGILGRGGEGPVVPIRCCAREDSGRAESCKTGQRGDQGVADGRHVGYW